MVMPIKYSLDLHKKLMTAPTSGLGKKLALKFPMT